MKLKKSIVHLDTLHLSVRYPKSDVFRIYERLVDGIDRRTLKDGVVYKDTVIQTGMGAYSLSVWDGDIRAYLTDDVDSKRGDGMGLGIFVQIGPRFLLKNADRLHEAVNEFLISIGVIGDWLIKINRMDLAIDLLGVSLSDQKTIDWQEGWVGRAKKNQFHCEREKIETIYIGAKRSAIYLRIYDKRLQASEKGDIEYWREFWGGFNGPVTRLEWQVDPREANFEDLVNFADLNRASFVSLANYLLTWGRLAIPDAGDSNQSRWENHPFWVNVEREIKAWRGDNSSSLKRGSDEFREISEGYVNSTAGTISGALARFAIDTPSFDDLFKGMAEFGKGKKTMLKDAEQKLKILKRLRK